MTRSSSTSTCPSRRPTRQPPGFTFRRSTPGDFAGSHAFPAEGPAPEPVDEPREFPAANTGAGPEPDGTGWSLPPGGPFLRTIEVAAVRPRAVIVALGGSSTAMGWPQCTVGILPADARIAVVNRGIPREPHPSRRTPVDPSWGRAGLSRFDEDVLGTVGVTHVVIACNSNDWGLPGTVTPRDEMPSVAQLTDAHQALIDRAQAAGLQPILATVTPLAPDDTHPNANGERRLAAAMVEALTRFQL